MAIPVRRIAALRTVNRPVGAAETGFWSSVNSSLSRGDVIPIISNSLRNDWIFAGLSFTSEETCVTNNGASNPLLSVDEQLAALWADEIGYPLRDRNDLARVAQYNLSRVQNTYQAKRAYLQFLKAVLLGQAEQDGMKEEELLEICRNPEEISFTDLANELEYPRLCAGQVDPLRLLARLPLKIYITTSYYEFLENALEAENKKPRTQVCFWNGEIFNVEDKHRPDPSFQPDVNTPLVYHLHGLERYPQTLVLTEDDYLDFLTAVSRDTDSSQPILPLNLRLALKESSLVLLGYRLRGWDFRTLLRGVIKPWETSLRPPSLAIQLRPEEQGEVENRDEAREFLNQYFKERDFDVEWARPERFIAHLWDGWNHWRMGQA